jgi:hypothetical protein
MRTTGNPRPFKLAGGTDSADRGGFEKTLAPFSFPLRFAFFSILMKTCLTL